MNYAGQPVIPDLSTEPVFPSITCPGPAGLKPRHIGKSPTVFHLCTHFMKVRFWLIAVHWFIAVCRRDGAPVLFCQKFISRERAGERWLRCLSVKFGVWIKNQCLGSWCARNVLSGGGSEGKKAVTRCWWSERQLQLQNPLQLHLYVKFISRTTNQQHFWDDFWLHPVW